MFNDDQKAHMAELASIPPEKRCWCGWYLLEPTFPSGKCPSCPPGRTCAEKLTLKCETCGHTPLTPESPPGHYARCPQRGSETER